ncbi:MAG TPA: 2-oxoacid:acceptor oxidoreductase subunit alpha [Bacteroidia bacterium]|nr:2-oxoacid:acceptor oxidoreductase subunit alpha [Bacteroidia bacterium]HRS57762.1 2-oxoacid:acceptor oxidoreductase subunit alpha [Bacteroidia bacterium]
MVKKTRVIELADVVIKFAGDSGDGMQLTGTQFSETSALLGNDVATFPDYPSEIRAPQGTVAGVSGFTVHIGHKEIYTSGDLADVLVAMNPAALKVNMKWIKRGATIILDSDNFNEKNYERAGYTESPFNDNSLVGYNVVKAPITTLTQKALEGMGLDNKTVVRSKNMFALGMLYWLFNKELTPSEKYFEKKFKSKPALIEANKKVLRAGYNFAFTLQEMDVIYKVPPLQDAPKGKYRNITGNVATAWGLIAASQKSGLPLFLGSYPITPASEILHELSNRLDFGVKAFQAEDEIAGICSAIGASFAGNLAVTTTSGPGLSLKSEAIGLAVMTELPIVIVDVQRGGPSTGLPTKTEQSDLMQALYGRNGEAPCIVIAASSSSDCFYYAYMAAKMALEHMTPVILLTDGYLGNGSEPLKIPKLSELPDIKTMLVPEGTKEYYPYKRDPETLARYWAVPGMPGLRHRVGGLEKLDVIGTVSHDPLNHQKMTELRQEKVLRAVKDVPPLKVHGAQEGDLLVVGWGGTYGSLLTAVLELHQEGKKIGLAHFNYIYPMPTNVEEIFSRFKKIIVCELNMGQFANFLRMQHQKFQYHQFNKVQGLPFMVFELKEKFVKMLES